MTETCSLSEKNQDFWKSLCGSELAQRFGVTEISPEGLRRYDQAYLDFYPYLKEHIPVDRFKGKRVLEVGLGYGTLGQRIMESGAKYTGLDISPGPVEMMRYRIESSALNGVVHQHDFLKTKYASGSFDAVVSIGCFHHTGSLQRCISEAHRLLRNDGTLYMMVYNAFSYRHFLDNPFKTLGRAALEKVTPERTSRSDRLRHMYDHDDKGEAAPFTEFASIKTLGAMLTAFSNVRFSKENCADGKVLGFKFANRSRLLPLLGRSLGTDIYVTAHKGIRT